MTDFVHEHNGKKYRLVKRINPNGSCDACAFSRRCFEWDPPKLNGNLLCIELHGIWKEVKDANGD